MASSDDSSRRRRVTFNQLETLWEFLNSHKEIATGYNKSAQAREHSRRMWESIAEALNSQGEGAVKDWKGWSSSRSGASGGGGGGAAMECGGGGGAAARAHAGQALPPTQRSPAKSGLHVNFTDKGEVKERREKFLTAKYGSHQMALIRKRLAVEMWLYDELQKLYEPSASAQTAAATAARAAGSRGAVPQEVDVDIDELLDMDSEELRRAHLKKLLADAKKPQKDVNKFINELLEKAKTL